jgi:hypothetical protein
VASRLRILLSALFAAAAFAVPAANAGLVGSFADGSCAASGSQISAAWSDGTGCAAPAVSVGLVDPPFFGRFG